MQEVCVKCYAGATLHGPGLRVGRGDGGGGHHQRTGPRLWRAQHQSSPPWLPGQRPCHRNSVADPGCLSRIRIFSIPGPNFFHPGSRIRIKEFKYFTQKCFISSRKYEIWSKYFASDPRFVGKTVQASGFSVAPVSHELTLCFFVQTFN